MLVQFEGHATNNASATLTPTAQAQAQVARPSSAGMARSGDVPSIWLPSSLLPRPPSSFAVRPGSRGSGSRGGGSRGGGSRGARINNNNNSNNNDSDSAKDVSRHGLWAQTVGELLAQNEAYNSSEIVVGSNDAGRGMDAVFNERDGRATLNEKQSLVLAISNCVAEFNQRRFELFRKSRDQVGMDS